MFFIKLPDEYVSEIDRNSPTTAREIYNIQREKLTEELIKRLIKPNITWIKEDVAISLTYSSGSFMKNILLIDLLWIRNY